MNEPAHMLQYPEYLHVLLNHQPVVGLAFSAAVLDVGVFRSSCVTGRSEAEAVDALIQEYGAFKG